MVKGGSEICQLVGQRLGDYELLSCLGGGGMGEVYVGFDRQLERKVAVKVLKSEFAQQEKYLERFRREAITAGNLHHPNIIKIYGFRADGEHPYIAMHLLPGGSLEDRIDSLKQNGARLEPKRVAEIIRPVAKALHYAHTNGVVHRDIKPANILFDDQGTPIVADFGIIKLLDQEKITTTGAALGTIPYMAPEMLIGTADVGYSVDQYALACTVYEMLTGELPFIGNDMLRRIINELPLAVHEVRRDLDPQVSEVLNKALAKLPSERYSTVQDFADALYVALVPNERIETPSPITPKRTQPIAAIGAGIAVLLVAVIAGLYALGWIPNPVSNPSGQSGDSSPVANAENNKQEATGTNVPTSTPTDVPEAIATGIPTQANTAIPTHTDVPTETPTLTELPTETPTTTASATPTSTDTPTQTGGVQSSTSVATVLGALGINPNTGSIGDTRQTHTFNLTNVTPGSTSTEWLSGAYTDIVFHAELSIGPGDEICNVWLSDQNSDEYGFRITNYPTVLMTKFVNSNWQGNRITYPTNFQQNGPNQVVIVAIADTFTVYVNDLSTPLAVFQDTTLPPPFDVGISAFFPSNTTSNQNPSCRFDDVWVWEPYPATPLPTPTLPATVLNELALAGGQSYTADNVAMIDGGQQTIEFEDRNVFNSENVYVDGNPNGILTDYVASTTITWGNLPDVNNELCGLIVRRQDSDNFYTLHINKRGELYFRERRDGSWPNYNGLDRRIGRVTPRESHSLTIRVEGNEFYFYVDGEYVGDYTDTIGIIADGGVAVIQNSDAVTFSNPSNPPYCTYTDTWVAVP